MLNRFSPIRRAVLPLTLASQSARPQEGGRCRPAPHARRGGGRASAAVLFAAAALAAVPARAVDGENDTTFRSTGKFLHVTPAEARVGVAFRANGTPVLGYSYKVGGTDRDVRILPVPDSGFTTHCLTFHPDLGGYNGDYFERIVTHGDRFFFAGYSYGPPPENDTQAFVVAIDRNTCQIDTSFSGPGGRFWQVDGNLWTGGLAVNPNGSVRLVAGYGPPDWSQINLVWKGWNAGGGNDAGFAMGLESFGVSFFLTGGMVRQPDGKLVIVGTITEANGDKDVGVLRLTTAGLLDSTFGVDGIVRFSYDWFDSGDDRAEAVAVLPDRRLVVAGSIERPNGTDAAVAVLTPSGGLDGNFGAFGRYTFEFGVAGMSDKVRAVAVQGDGKILVAGSTGPDYLEADTEFGVARLRSTGTSPLDPSFGYGGLRIIPFDVGGYQRDSATDIALDPQGRIVVAGYAETATSVRGVAAVRLTNSYIFADSFEWASLQAWSAVGGQ